MTIETTYAYYVYDSLTDEELGDVVEGLWQRFGQTVDGRFQAESSDDRTAGWLSYDDVGGHLSRQSDTESLPVDCAPDCPHLELRFATKDNFKFPVSESEIENIDGEYAKRVGDAVDLIAEVYRELDPKPTIGYGLTPLEINSMDGFDSYGPPVSSESMAEARLEQLPWVAVLPPAFVDTYGRERLQEAPVWRAEEVDEGAVLLAAYQDVLRGLDSQRGALYDHFGLDDPLDPT